MSKVSVFVALFFGTLEGPALNLITSQRTLDFVILEKRLIVACRFANSQNSYRFEFKKYRELVATYVDHDAVL